MQSLIDSFATKSAIFTDSDNKNVYATFMESLNQMYNGEKKFTLVLDDPLGYTFVWCDDIKKYDINIIE